jgi:chromosome segregation ATPase
MTVQKETFTDRTKAGRALVFLAAALKPFQTTRAIGAIGGFPISLQRLESRTSITIHGRHMYEANASDNALGTISSLEHALVSLDERLHERESDLKQLHRQHEDLAKQIGQPFEHEERLSAANNRQQEIVSALDITKNQASATLDECPAEQLSAEPLAQHNAVPARRAVTKGVQI